MDFNPSNPLPHRHESSNQALMRHYFQLEAEFMPARDYRKQKKFIDIRSIALSDIKKYESDEVDVIVIFLAITFFDRFLSRNTNIPVIKSGEGFESNLELFVFCCVSIASKIRCLDFSFVEFLDKHQVGSAADVLVMELQILEGLRWRVRPPNTITFLNLLLPLVKSKDQPVWLLFHPLSRIVFELQRDIRFTEFRPSTLAASAILVTSYRLLPAFRSETLWKVLTCGFIQQSEVERCFEELKEHPIVDYILNPAKDPLDVFKQRFRRHPGWWERQKEIIEVEVKEEEEEQEQEEDINMEEPDPDLVQPDPNVVQLQPVQGRRYNTFQRILITCFFPIICRCLGYEIVSRERPN